MLSWTSYPKILALGHRGLRGLFDDPVRVEEKVDGSQISFGMIEGQLHIRSKGREFDIDGPDAMFAKAAVVVKELAPLLVPGWTYRGEYLRTPKHNALAYDRIPKRHIVLFDVAVGLEDYAPRHILEAEGNRLGLEVTPCLFDGHTSAVEVMALLGQRSFLGGAPIEGVVVKNTARFGADGKPLYGKFVSQEFKEVHRSSWKQDQPTGKDVVAAIAEQYRAEARWRKAVEHTRDAGTLLGEPRDIPQLIVEVQRDIAEECAEEIKEQLWQWAQKTVMRSACRGLAEWYKESLACGKIDL